MSWGWKGRPSVWKKQTIRVMHGFLANLNNKTHENNILIYMCPFFRWRRCTKLQNSRYGVEKSKSNNKSLKVQFTYVTEFPTPRCPRYPLVFGRPSSEFRD